METLSQIYSDIANKKNSWCYYNNPTFTIDKAWEKEKDAYCFIKKYFEYGGKLGLLERLYYNQRKNEYLDRAPHIVSAYLLGIYLGREMGISYFTTNDGSHSFDFLYLWFISCLYHDYGYLLEKNPSSYMDSVSRDGIPGFKKHYSIDYFCDKVFQTFSKEDINLYLKCRAGEDKLDHGITGGLLLYDSLRKMFEQSWSNRIPDRNETRESFHIWSGGRELHLSKNDFGIYAMIADAVICHNIYNGTLIRYRKTVSNYDTVTRKANIQDDALYFILSLTDTLEPIKRHQTLDSILVSYNKEKMNLTVAVNNKMKDEKEYLDQIDELQDWLDVSITRRRNKRIIHFNLPNS